MNTSPTLSRRLPPVASLLVITGLAVAVGACSAVGNAPVAAPDATPSASPSAAPSPTPTPVAATASPTATPAPTPTPASTPTPSDPGSDAMPIRVDLVNATHHNVYVDVVDQSGKVLSGLSGKPGDGATVATGKLKVENVDAKTLRLTWTDSPGDNALALYIDKTLTHFVLVQPEHAGDAIPFDRILILKFSVPISAGNIEAVLQNGTDTIG